MKTTKLETLWRLYIMTRKAENIIKGLSAGMAAGLIVGAAGAAIMTDKKKSKKMFSKAVTKVEDVLDNVQEVLA